ncbi:MAG: aminotransferase class III-fold pyridoxal phosphate-dependent enzyme, partial [Acidobacteriota bacterium]
LLGKLRELDSPFVGDVRGMGLIIAVELVSGGGDPLDAERTGRVQARIREEGVLIGRMSYAAPGPESVLELAPPLILTEAQADQIAAAFRAGLQSIQ